MGAHETPASVLAAVETDAIRLRAARLVAQFDADMARFVETGHSMDRADWVIWEGEAYAVLRELVRG